MTKQIKSIRLSEHAADLLKELAGSMFPVPVSEGKVIEFLILHRAEISDKEKNFERRCRAWEEYHSEHEAADRSSFQAGYEKGWLHFQTRTFSEPTIDL